MKGDAIFSKCKRYRFTLYRWWNNNLPQVIFVMLNPSSADAEKDDPTIRKCIGYAKSWGCGSIKVLNLFALRATDPYQLFDAKDPIGDSNDWWLKEFMNEELPFEPPKYVVCAWGNHGSFMGRSDHVLEMWKHNDPIINSYALKINKSGEPSHPLYLKNGIRPLIYCRVVDARKGKNALA